jgi:cell division protein FtsQ
MEIAPDTSEPAKTYHFPVITGISANDPAGTRAARMKLFERFTAELDFASKSPADKVTNDLSEVDLTDPEDIKALMADTGILIHFGDRDFLPRYRHYTQNLPDWKVRYPKLASADMRYGNQVVLQMAPGTSVPSTSDTAPDPAPRAVAKRQTKAGVKTLLPASRRALAAKHHTGLAHAKPSLKAVAAHKAGPNPETKAHPKAAQR